MKIGLGITDQNALTYFEELVNRIVSDRGLEENKRKDFLQMCVNMLIEDPSLTDPDTKVDEFGDAWSTKG